jgi:outer membrane protein assembly factor BamD (BamD/ComL family)
MRPLAILLLIVPLVGCARGGRDVPAQDNVELVEARGIESPVLLQAARELDAGDSDAAHERLRTMFRARVDRQPPVVQERDYALYLMANTLVAEDRRVRAFYYLDELLDTYPESSLYRPALRRQYEIADSYLSGRDDRTLFFPQGGRPEALEMLFRIQQRAPGSELAETALIRSADFYFDRGEYDFAEDAYTVFLDAFPNAKAARRAKLRQAWSNLLQYEGPRYDPTPLLDARQQFEQILADDPGLARQADVPEAMAYIDRQLAKKQQIQSDWYARTGHPEVAANLMVEAEESAQ